MNGLTPVLQLDDGTLYPLTRDGVTTIGANGAGITLIGDGVLPFHATLIKNGGRVSLRADAGAVTLNDAPLRGIALLSPYDLIGIGTVTLRYRLDASVTPHNAPPVEPIKRPVALWDGDILPWTPENSTPPAPDNQEETPASQGNTAPVVDDESPQQQKPHSPLYLAPPIPPSAIPPPVQGFTDEDGVLRVAVRLPVTPSKPAYLPPPPPENETPDEPLPVLYKPPMFYIQGLRYLKIGTIAIFALDETDLVETFTRKIAGLSEQPCPLVFSRMGMEVPSLPKTTAKKLVKTDVALFHHLSHRERKSIELVFTICYVESTSPDGRDAFAFVNLRGDRIETFVSRARANAEPFNVIEHSTIITVGYGKATPEHFKYMRENYLFGSDVTNVRIFPPLGDVT